MPTPIPSPLRSAFTWLRASHLRLLIAGLVAVGLIGAVSIFAADPRDQDIVDISAIGDQQNPKDGVNVGQDFAMKYSFKPHAKLKKYNLRVTLDGQAVENRRWENANGASGTQVHDYNFRYGMDAGRTKRTTGFDWTLLRPGNHILVVRACDNDLPSTSCKQLARKQLIFKVPAQGTGASPKAIAIGETTLTLSPFTAGAGAITAPTDSRIKSNVVSPAQLAEEQDPQKGNSTEPALGADDGKGDNAGKTRETDHSREATGIVDTTLALIGQQAAPAAQQLSLTETVHAAARYLTVQVNPIGLTPGHTEVEISPANCTGGSRKPVPGGGVVHFGPCGDTNHSAIAHPGSFRNGNQTCTAVVQSAPVNNNANLYYSCIADAVPAPPPPPPAPAPNPDPGGGGSPTDDRAQVKVWVNPRPAMNGTNVTLKGTNGDAGCGDQKTVNDGAVIFGNCRVGKQVTVTVPKNRMSGGWDYEVGDNSRTITVAKNDANNVIEFFYYGGQTGTQSKETAPIKVWVNPIGKSPDNLEVSIRGGQCTDANGNRVYNQKKKVGSDGTVTFGNCDVGAGYITSVPAQFTDSDGFVWHVGPNGQERKLDHLSPSPSGVPSWVPEYHYTLNDGDTGDVVKKPGPMIALRSISPAQAVVDLFKFGAGPEFNIGQVKQVKATVDGTVTDDHVPPVPPITVDGTVRGYNYFPTIKNETLKLGNLADGKAHTVQLQAIATTGATRTITVHVQGSDAPPPTAPPSPSPKPSASPTGSPVPTPSPSQTPNVSGKGTIIALVYEDKNGNGKRESGETGLANVNVNAATGVETTGTDGKKQVKASAGVSVKTDANGTATFADLPNATYLVKAETLAGYGPTTPVGQDVTIENDTQDVEFGEQKLAPKSTPQASPKAESAPTEKGSGNAQTQGVLGNLPKTGQAGLILFLTFLVASAIYYGGRKLVAKRARK